MRVFPIIDMTKKTAAAVCGSLTQTTKMPCESYSLPTVACVTGFKMSKIAGSICNECYANKGNYQMYAANIEPAQHMRLHSIELALSDATLRDEWLSAMVKLIGSAQYFRWHDSGDLQSVEHLALIAEVCDLTPHCSHWLPTREYAMVRDYLSAHGALPKNIMVRLSAMYFDKPVTVPVSLQNVPNVATSNVHKHGAPLGQACIAPKQNGECRECRACWHAVDAISYHAH